MFASLAAVCSGSVSEGGGTELQQDEGGFLYFDTKGIAVVRKTQLKQLASHHIRTRQAGRQAVR